MRTVRQPPGRPLSVSPLARLLLARPIPARETHIRLFLSPCGSHRGVLPPSLPFASQLPIGHAACPHDPAGICTLQLAPRPECHSLHHWAASTAAAALAPSNARQRLSRSTAAQPIRSSYMREGAPPPPEIRCRCLVTGRDSLFPGAARTFNQKPWLVTRISVARAASRLRWSVGCTRRNESSCLEPSRWRTASWVPVVGGRSG